MIRGSVSDLLEPRIPLIVLSATGRRQEVSAVVDTGFNGQLAFPHRLIERLQLVVVGVTQAMLADGMLAEFSYYHAGVAWNRRTRTARVLAIDGEPLVGMEFLERHNLNVEIVRGGSLTIAAGRRPR